MTSERNKLQVRIESLVATNTVNEAEMTVIKKEILKVQRAEEDIRIMKENQE